MRLEEITDKIVHVNFPTQYLLSSTFLRFQEHFESPKFSGKIFSLEEYMDWYSSVQGSFSYYQDWGGFNVPSPILKPFYQGKFDPLSKKEEKFLDLFREKKDKFYIIGTYSEKNAATLKHELAHGFFYTVPKYKKEVLKALEGVKTSEIRKYLLSIGYCKKVLTDETHAFLLTNLDMLREEGIKTSKFKKVHDKLENIFAKYKKSLISS